MPALLKYFRNKAGLTQSQVASALSLSRSGYANYEEGRNLPNIEQTIQLSELLNHDLLYAYTLSSRYMKEKSGKNGAARSLTQVPALVMESNTYLKAIENNENMAALINNYQSLSSTDRQLVDHFVADLSSKSSQCPEDFSGKFQ